MRSAYSDPRFPGAEIVNNGSGTFEVWLDGKLEHTFESWESPDGTVSESFAQRRAQSYFDRWASFGLGRELDDELHAASPEAGDSPEPKATGPQIDLLMAKEKAESDPDKKAALRREIMGMMRREESLPESVVNHLLGI